MSARARAWATVATLCSAVALSVLTPACAPPRLAPMPADAAWASARWPGTTAADLDAGYAIYRDRCAGCHHLPVPGEHPIETWERKLPEMAGKAKLTPAQEELVLHYVLAIRAHSDSASAGM